MKDVFYLFIGFNFEGSKNDIISLQFATLISTRIRALRTAHSECG